MGNVDLRVTSEIAPLQIEGTIDGLHVYYRDRHARWTVGFGHDEHTAVSHVFDQGQSDYAYDRLVAYARIMLACQAYVKEQR